MSTTIRVTDYTADVLKAIRDMKEHKNYDSALREVFREADLDEQKLLEKVRGEDEDGGWDLEQYK